MLVLSRRTRYVLARQPHLVGVARRVVTQRIGAWGARLDEDRASTLQLLVSEIVTNAIQHTTSAFIGVDLSVTGRRLLVAVADDSPVFPVAADGGLTAWEGEHGRGMFLVAALADAHGWRRTCRGKRVWFRLALPQALAPCNPAGRAERRPSSASYGRLCTRWPLGLACAGGSASVAA
jgi:anti-sigma regulatory factor (Ser/Thr protein kinase)